MPTLTLATCVSSRRSSKSRLPPSSTTAITTLAPLALASASAAAAMCFAAPSVKAFLSTSWASLVEATARIPTTATTIFKDSMYVSSSTPDTRLIVTAEPGGGLNSRPPPRQLSIAPSDHHRDDSIMSSRSAAAVLSGAGNDASPSRPNAITADKTAKRTLRNEPLMELLLVDGLCPGPRSGRGPCIRLVLGRVCSLHEPLGNQSRTLRLRRVRFDDNHSGRCSALMCHGSVWRRTPDDLNAISLTDAKLSFEDHVKKVAASPSLAMISPAGTKISSPCSRQLLSSGESSANTGSFRNSPVFISTVPIAFNTVFRIVSRLQ